MHECNWCVQMCDCDGEDLMQIAPSNCECELDDAENDDADNDADWEAY